MLLFVFRVNITHHSLNKDSGFEVARACSKHSRSHAGDLDDPQLQLTNNFYLTTNTHC